MIQVEKIRNSITIPEYFKIYIDPNVNLGTTLKILCPFHEDNTPSFTYSPEKGIARCWSGPHCGGGDVIWLHQRNYKITTREEATESIAKLLGIKDTDMVFTNLPIKCDEQKVRFETLLTRANRSAKVPSDWIALDQLMTVWKPIHELVEDLELYLKVRGRI